MQGKRIPFLGRFAFLGAILFMAAFMSTPINAATAPAQDSGPARAGGVLGSGNLPPSELADKELEKIYNSSESIEITPKGPFTAGVSIEPWKEAKIMLKANRDNMLDLELKATNYSLYLQGMGKNDTPQAEILVNHFLEYCAKSATNEGASGTNRCQDDPLLQHGDINANSLVAGFRYDPKRETAARLFVNNLVNPFPTEDLKDPKMLTPEKTKDPKTQKIIAEALAEQTVLSTARSALASIFAKRIPVANVKGGVSFMEMMEKEAAKNFMNEAWQKDMQKKYEDAMKAGKPEFAILYHNAIRDAYANYLLYQMYRELEESKMLLATMVTLIQRQGKAGAAVVSSATGSGPAPAGGGR